MSAVKTLEAVARDRVGKGAARPFVARAKFPPSSTEVVRPRNPSPWISFASAR